MEQEPITWKRAGDGLIIPIAPGVRHSGEPSLTARAEAIGRLPAPGAVVVRRTAAWLWGLDVLPPGANQAEWPVDLQPAGLLPADHTVERSGVRVTTLTRTALDCARWLPRLEAVAALDQFLHRGVPLPALRAMARAPTGYPGNTKLGEVFRAADPRAESPGESWTRTLVIDAGLPRPRAQIPVMGPRGEPLYIDLGYERFQVGLEYDGERHHTGARARAYDQARRRWLGKEMGWDIIPVTKDFLSSPAPYLEALLTALLHRGWNPAEETMDRIATRLARLRRRRHHRHR
ncbi:hypothetical protein [Actinomadura macrotermitis]|uniref:DUF559 domain-containing protein n=1 Tax=Actinomadura macrotermitis TaxID=2585200 RepID=A0A7K0C7H7_9ACTN|nr:hypothetical protein [Actinomadura macrotermitis]MQY09419.1 hypothetical protein [Actinomadura macrotermitis]